jgi:hypothetical protein
MFTYVILDNLPQVPEKFEENIQHLLDTENFSSDGKVYEGDSLIQNSAGLTKNRELLIHGEKFKSVHSVRFDMGDEWRQWVAENIHPNIELNMQGVAFTTGGRYHGAHADATRNYALIYVIDSGGKNVNTVFYQEKNQPLLRPRTLAVDRLTVDDYSLLDEFEKVNFPTKKWVLINTRIIHGVENIEKIRIAYQIGFDKNIWFTDRENAVIS